VTAVASCLMYAMHLRGACIAVERLEDHVLRAINRFVDLSGIRICRNTESATSHNFNSDFFNTIGRKLSVCFRQNHIERLTGELRGPPPDHCRSVGTGRPGPAESLRERCAW
jgi:hypothetical protein